MVVNVVENEIMVDNSILVNEELLLELRNYSETILIELRDLHVFQKINHKMINRNNVVANVYAPMNKSTIKIKGNPANANPRI
ncbi:MAG: hypothetical protein BAJALOKI1v1_530003 [Promethearchaeota archaeon]|nr:MAG: hypothetical protein BAJALOKI1v1_530003 [Candidatus Lokiarchaeota archaeon]